MNNLIFDVGAHKGEDSDFYLKLGYRVVAIEANPALADYLRKRFDGAINEGRYIVVEKAIGESDEGMAFYVNKMISVWGTADRTWAIRNEQIGAYSEEITVQGIRFSDVLNKYGCPYYMKIDVEGADMLCIKALHGLPCRPKYISIESTKTSWLDLLEEFNTLEKLGYSKFKVVNQRKHANGRFKDINGNTVEHEFEEGATGPFGQLFDDVWLTKKEAIRRYIPIFFIYKTIGVNTFLYKAIRQIPLLRRALYTMSWYDTHAMRE